MSILVIEQDSLVDVGLYDTLYAVMFDDSFVVIKYKDKSKTSDKMIYKQRNVAINRAKEMNEKFKTKGFHVRTIYSKE